MLMLFGFSLIAFGISLFVFVLMVLEEFLIRLFPNKSGGKID